MKRGQVALGSEKRRSGRGRERRIRVFDVLGSPQSVFFACACLRVRPECVYPRGVPDGGARTMAGARCSSRARSVVVAVVMVVCKSVEDKRAGEASVDHQPPQGRGLTRWSRPSSPAQPGRLGLSRLLQAPAS